MSTERKGFIIYKDIEEVLEELSDEQAGKLFKGIVQYFSDGKDPGFTGELKFAFIPIRQQMDRNSERYESRCQRNRENIAKRWQKKTESDTNVYDGIRTYTNDTDTDKDTDKDKDKDKDTDTKTESGPQPDAPSPSLPSSLISYLNEKAGSKYRATEDVSARIEELLSAGYTEQDMRSVIDKKVAEWKDSDKMRNYLRPRTLFGDKFEEYVSAPDPAEVQDDHKREETVTSLKDQRKHAVESIRSLDESIQKLRASPGGIRGDWNRYKDLTTQKAVEEQRLETIDNKLKKLG